MRNPDPIHEYHRMVNMFLDQQLNDDESRQMLHQAQGIQNSKGCYALSKTSGT